MERHRYGRSSSSQYGELFLPDGGGPHPVAVTLHGGFWKAGYGRKLMWPLCGDLVRRGWAGGQLAAWVAAQPELGVRAAVSQAGVVDLTMAAGLRLSAGVVERLLGGTPEAVPDRYAAASPAALVPIGVPILAIHGADDDVVPAEMSERFAERARLAGDDVTLEVFDGEDHMGHLDPANRMWLAAADWLERWRTG